MLGQQYVTGLPGEEDLPVEHVHVFNRLSGNSITVADVQATGLCTRAVSIVLELITVTRTALALPIDLR
jgi:hypothetical protein